MSLSELLPSDYRATIMTIGGGAEVTFAGGGLEIVRGTAFGSNVMKGKDLLGNHPDYYKGENLAMRSIPDDR